MLAGVIAIISWIALGTFVGGVATIIAYRFARYIASLEMGEDTSCDDTYLLRVLGGEGHGAIGGGGGKPYAPQPSGTLNNSAIARHDGSEL